MNYSPTENAEWTVSLEPNDFVVVLENKGETLKDIPFVAFAFSLGHQEEADADGHYETTTHIHAVRKLDGIYPGEEIPKTDESMAFLNDNIPRIEEALNGWSRQPADVQEQYWNFNGLQQTIDRLFGTGKG